MSRQRFEATHRGHDGGGDEASRDEAPLLLTEDSVLNSLDGLQPSMGDRAWPPARLAQSLLRVEQPFLRDVLGWASGRCGRGGGCLAGLLLVRIRRDLVGLVLLRAVLPAASKQGALRSSDTGTAWRAGRQVHALLGVRPLAKERSGVLGTERRGDNAVFRGTALPAAPLLEQSEWARDTITKAIPPIFRPLDYWLLLTASRDPTGPSGR